MDGRDDRTIWAICAWRLEREIWSESWVDEPLATDWDGGGKRWMGRVAESPSMIEGSLRRRARNREKGGIGDMEGGFW